MNIYEISQPGKQIVDVQGVAIRTENVSVTIPPALPNTFRIFARRYPDGLLVEAMPPMTSWSVPTIVYEPYFSSGFTLYWYGTNQLGQQIGNFTPFSRFLFGSAFITPGNTTVNRCDIIVTVQSSPLQEIRLQGNNGQPCGTWTTRSIDDCRDTEIKCNDPSDPRGFCCIPCDTLNTKLRGLIV